MERGGGARGGGGGGEVGGGQSQRRPAKQEQARVRLEAKQEGVQVGNRRVGLFDEV